MGVAHLQGKRTRRPKGAKTRPAWLRALAWAERHLGDPTAAPPSPLAAQYLRLSREYPERFLACLAARDANRYQPLDGLPVELRPNSTSRLAPSVVTGPGQVMTLVISHRDLRRMIAGEPPRMKVMNAPAYIDILGGVMTGRGLALAVRSDALAPLGPGQAIPEVTAMFSAEEVRGNGRWV